VVGVAVPVTISTMRKRIVELFKMCKRLSGAAHDSFGVKDATGP
jgi:hypothetical protein